MRALRASDQTTTLKTFADVNVGVVTGRNQFFVLRQSEVERLDIFDHTVPLISRSVQLKGAKIDVSDWRRLAKADDRVHLLDLEPLNGSKLTPELDVYIQRGERMKVHQGYKCSIRTPWYAVPAVWTPDAFVFRQIYDFPRNVLNRARATSTDTIHRMKCRASPEQTVAATYTHLTAASAEIEGRSYGGGVLELEPTEATNLLMPAELWDAMPVDECDELIRQDRLADVLHHNDRAVPPRSCRAVAEGVLATQVDLGEDARPAALPPTPVVVSDSVPKAEARAQVAGLVAAFKRNEGDYVSVAYNETQARTDFISPLLAAFGWDVHNAKGHQLALREVIEEPSVEVGEERVNKRPDYELRLARQRKLFVEAKKPSIRIDMDPAPAFQIRRYGFSASLPISVLTNFRHLAIYDCRHRSRRDGRGKRVPAPSRLM